MKTDYKLFLFPLTIFEVFTVMKIHVAVFWLVTQCNDVVG